MSIRHISANKNLANMFLGAIYDFILVLLLTMGDNLSVKKMFFVPARELAMYFPVVQ